MRTFAVIGAGVAGIAAAHHLSSRFRVTLYEADSRLGGHTNTVTIERGPDKGTAVDTGFIVFNRRNYPHFSRFLEELGVESRDGDMSFGYHCRQSGLQWGGHDASTLFAQPVNVIHPDFLRLVIDMFRFNRAALRALDTGSAAGLSLLEFVRRQRLSSFFMRHYLVPLGAALWSAQGEAMQDFPAQTYLRFFHNHGLLSLVDRPHWLTVKGGSARYLDAFFQGFQGEIRLSTPVLKVVREGQGVRVCSQGQQERYDGVVLATHADISLALLQEPTALERELLGAFRYADNDTVLHTDTQVMPPLRKVWSSWNYYRDSNSGGSVTVTYDMNRLMGLSTQRRYLVTLNGAGYIRPETIHGRFHYRHPQFDTAAEKAQSRLPELNRQGGVYFAGSYFGFGFHEDAYTAGMAAAKAVDQPAFAEAL